MSIESTSTSPPVGKAAHAGAGGKGATAVAGDALGFLAMLSAADDALTLSADTSGLADGAGGEGASPLFDADKDLLALDADANALAGWVLGVPGPTAPDTAPRMGAGRAPGAAGAEDAGAVGGVLLPSASRKAGKVLGTTELQQAQSVHTTGVSQGPEQRSQQVPEAKVTLAAAEVPLAPSQETPEVAPMAVLAALGERHSPEHPVGMKAAAPTDGSYFQPQAASAPMGMDGVVAAQSAAPLEAYVAEQVSYWIAQDVQSAELTLDGMGASPVEVSISMQGNEAQVAFRTDELHARAAIENASEQLKDSLQRQGVMLTGMSVGTSHGGDASGQGRRQRQEGRQAVVTGLAPASSEAALRQPMAQGRAVDLFV